MVGSTQGYCGLLLSSGFPLAELPSISTDEPASLLLSTLEEGNEARSWVHHWTDESEVLISLGRVGSTYVLRFADGTLFGYDRRDRIVRCPSKLDASARHQLLDQVLPRVLDDLGHLMIHGSAVATPNGAVVFIGDSGLGKSTLAGSFSSAGLDLLSDDCMRLNADPDGVVSCIPTYRSLRLWPDSADAVMPSTPFEAMAAHSHKRRLNLAESPPVDHSTVAAICVLAPPSDDADAITVEPVAAARAVSLLLAQCFRLDPTDAEATKRTFERCAEIVERVPVVELSYPREYDRLPEVREAVLRRAATGDWAAVKAS